MTPSRGRASNPTEPSFWQVDKRDHYLMTGLITGSTYLVLRKMSYNRWESLVTSIAVGALIGTAKEVYDRTADPGDIKADVVGAVSVGGLFFTVDLIAF